MRGVPSLPSYIPVKTQNQKKTGHLGECKSLRHIGLGPSENTGIKYGVVKADRPRTVKGLPHTAQRSKGRSVFYQVWILWPSECCIDDSTNLATIHEAFLWNLQFWNVPTHTAESRTEKNHNKNVPSLPSYIAVET